MPHTLPTLQHEPYTQARNAATSGGAHLLRRLAGLTLAIAAGVTFAGCSQPEPAVVQASTPPTPIIVVAPPVEVTRVVYTEQIVVATPMPPHACAPQTLAGAKEIVVALLAPISDPASLPTTLGVQTALAAAVGEVNAGGGVEGVPLRLRIADTAGGPEEAARQAEESITVGCATALIGSSSSAIARSVLEVAHRYGVPYFVVDAADDALTATGYPEIFRLAPTNSMLVDSPGGWLSAVGDYNKDGQKSALVIVEEGDAAATHGEWMENELERRGFTTDTYTVMLPSQDFSSLVARIVTRPVMPDVIFNRIGGDPGLILQRQLVDNGIGPQKQSVIVASRSALQDEHFWSIVGPKGVNTVVGRVGPWKSTAGDTGIRLAEVFARYTDRWPEASSFAAYDALHLLAGAMERSPSLASGDLIPALEASDVELAGGRVRFPFAGETLPEGQGKPAWAWHQWLDVPLLFLEYTEPNQPSADMAVLWPPQEATVAGPVVRPPPP